MFLRVVSISPPILAEIHNRSYLLQSDHPIDSERSPRRCVTGGKGNRNQKQRRQQIRRWVASRDSIQLLRRGVRLRVRQHSEP